MASPPDSASQAKANDAPATPVIPPEDDSSALRDLLAGNANNLRFPEHASGERTKPSIKDIMIGLGQQNMARAKCERNVRKVIESSTAVKLMMAALKSAGCPMDISRHINCEQCDISVHGGFDPENKQIVVCQNVATNLGKVTSVLAHEMVHAFDYCRSSFDYKNIDHLACSEIRASTLTHCSFVSAFFGGSTSPFDYKNTHQICVKTKATESVRSCLSVPLETALEAVERVFPKCYKDLEPFGRIPRRNSRDSDRAYFERMYYGYDAE